MRLLLDTNVILWEMERARSIGPHARKAIEDADELLVSVISFAEIGIKAATGRLMVPPDLRDRLIGGGVRILGLAPEHGLGLVALPMHHRDPFDRLLISQARIESLTLVTSDAGLAPYDVPMIDARA